jgi:hypothetical protein
MALLYFNVPIEVCMRVLRAVKELSAKDSTLSVTTALSKYCSIDTLNTEEMKFCYNIDTMKKDLFRLLEFGASNERVCQKVFSTNKDFCQVKIKSTSNKDKTAAASSNSNNKKTPGHKKGLIYI